LRQTVVLWNVDPKDFAASDAAAVADHFVREPLAGGDIVLLHDTHPHAAGALPRVVAGARERGLRFVTVDRWTRLAKRSALSA
jgi:peptidoglycan/xylan/chitin deacetylase (PgdA/CDA1 family)